MTQDPNILLLNISDAPAQYQKVSNFGQKALDHYSHIIIDPLEIVGTMNAAIISYTQQSDSHKESHERHMMNTLNWRLEELNDSGQ